MQGTTMERSKLQALTAELAKDIKTEADLNALSRELLKLTERLKSQHGEVEILSPRDRDGSFEPQLLRKQQTRLTQMDDQILTLYAKGLMK